MLIIVWVRGGEHCYALADYASFSSPPPNPDHASCCRSLSLATHHSSKRRRIASASPSSLRNNAFFLTPSMPKVWFSLPTE